MTQAGSRFRLIVFDRSGSMGKIREGMQQGFLEFIAQEEAATPPGGKLRFSLWDFDTEVRELYSFATAGEVRGYVLEPRGMTALWDAMAQAYLKVGRDLAAMPEDERPEDVTVLTISDGDNNQKIEFDAADVEKMVTHQKEKYGWRQLYIGTDQDVAANAAKAGVNQHMVLSYAANSAGSAGAWNATASYLSRVPVAAAAPAAAAAGYSAAERGMAAASDGDADADGNGGSTGKARQVPAAKAAKLRGPQQPLP